MADRGLDVFEKYDFEVNSISKGRGVIIADTNKGARLLKGYIGSGKHLEWCARTLEGLNESGVLNVDAYEKNNEGSYITESADGGKYVVKCWYPCRDIDSKNMNDILMAIRNLAFLHKELTLADCSNEYEEKPIIDEYIRKSKELCRVKKYLSGRYEKSEFEQLAAKSFEKFMPEVEGAISFGQKYFENCSLTKYLCHCNFNQHNIAFGEKLAVISNFEKMSYGYQLKDLYTFMRKILEKNNWDVRIGHSMINEYDRIMHISADGYELLYVLFSFPEKYWKLMNSYYNSKKSFLPYKNIEKLTKLIEQNVERRAFIDTIH